MNISPVSSSLVPTASPPATGRVAAENAATGVAPTGEVSATKPATTVAGASVANASPVETAQQAQPSPPSKEALQKALDDVKQAIPPAAQDLLFSIDKDTGKTVVKVVDATTKKVLRQIPSEEIMAIAKSLDKFDKLQGLLVKQKV